MKSFYLWIGQGSVTYKNAPNHPLPPWHQINGSKHLVLGKDSKAGVCKAKFGKPLLTMDRKSNNQTIVHSVHPSGALIEHLKKNGNVVTLILAEGTHHPHNKRQVKVEL